VPFAVRRSSGPAAELHHRPIPDPAVPVIWWHDVTVPALVLGSAQDGSVVDLDACRAAGVDVVRRRSGGGAVLLVPGECVWFDVIVPIGTIAAIADVRTSMVWLGRHLRAAVGIGSVHEGGMDLSPWSRLICFDGVGPGEISVDGSKLIGISQRRTRGAARFQVCWHTVYDPAALPSFLDPGHRPRVDQLRPVGTRAGDDSARVLDVLWERLDAEWQAGRAAGRQMGENG
jgi:hypothetical protein